MSTQDSVMHKECVLGIVTQLGPFAVKVLLATGEQDDSGAGSNIGDFVLLACGSKAVLGQVSDVRFTSDSIAELVEGLEGKRSGRVSPVATVELLSTVDLNTGLLTPGLEVRPKVGARVYLAPPEMVREVVQQSRRGRDGQPEVNLTLAQLPDTGGMQVSFTPERIFGSHCAVLGTTGAGKSWSVARLVEECAKHQCKVLLFDATGEFHTLTSGVRHVAIGASDKHDSRVREVVVPYHQLTESDLFAIFKPTGESQPSKLRAAMKSLKLASLDSSVALDGTIIKAHKSKVQYERAYEVHMGELEGPYARFNIQHLIAQIQNECVNPQRSTNEPLVWGGPNNSDHANCVPLINRIQDALQSPNLAPIFQPANKPSLFKELQVFYESPTDRVLRVSLEYLSFLHNAREIIVNAIGRQLLEAGRGGVFRGKPLMIVMDEAHQFLNKYVGGDENPFPLDSFDLIAKEGRKYALTITIATQRPRDIPEGVLSQMGTMIVHRLINDRDRHVIERASGEIDRSSAGTIPTLAPGEAVIIGVDFPVPVLVQMLPPEHKPQSSGPDYQHYWQ